LTLVWRGFGRGGRGRGGGRVAFLSKFQLSRCRFALWLLTIHAVRDSLPHPDDFHLAQECIEGKTSALTHLQETYREPLLAFLQGSGARPHEAREIVTELWSDCIAPQTGSTPKLARYNGMCALKTFLNTITLNALVSVERKKKRRQDLLPGVVIEETTESGAADLSGPADPVEPAEAPLLDLMRKAIEAAFRACPAEDFVLLQLAHTDDLHVMELAKMFNRSKSALSRDVQRAGREIAEATIQYVKATDPWLELKWEDFVELCRSASPACFGVE
jgi:RNA polymerase sigma factor (sigma-70 family)